MLRSHIKLLLFLNSYSPLFLIFLIVNSSKNISVFVSLLLLALIILPIFFLFYVFGEINKFEGNITKIKKVDNKSNEALNYIFAYIIPFLDINLGELTELLAVSILFIIIAILYINSNLIYTNPILTLIGYKIYQIEDEHSNLMILITKKGFLKIDSNIITINIENNVYMSRE